MKIRSKKATPNWFQIPGQKVHVVARGVWVRGRFVAAYIASAMHPAAWFLPGWPYNQAAWWQTI